MMKNPCKGEITVTLCNAMPSLARTADRASQLFCGNGYQDPTCFDKPSEGKATTAKVQ